MKATSIDLSEIPVKKNDSIILEIQDLGVHGEGIGRFEGYTLFVADALPGEQVEVKVVKVGKKYGFAKRIHIEKASPMRCEAKCPVARTCGGCQLQSMTYEGQLAHKMHQIEENLKRIGHMNQVPMQPIIGMQDPWFYRNKVTYPVREHQGLTTIGFYAKGSHRVIEHKTCYIQDVRNEAIVATIKEWMLRFNVVPYDETKGTGVMRHIMTRHSAYEDAFHVTLVSNKRKVKHLETLVDDLNNLGFIAGISLSRHQEKNNVILGEHLELISGSLYLEEHIGGIRYKISPKSFFQVNLQQTEKLYHVVKSLAALKPHETLIDLYCGIGTITLYLAGEAKSAIGIEVVEAAIEDAFENQELNQITNVDFYVGPVEEVMPALYEEAAIKADVVVIDPPRKGCEPIVLETIAKMAPSRIVYVSCDPATLARDVAQLREKGYEVTCVQPVDLFGHTVHVETVVLMSRVDK